MLVNIDGRKVTIEKGIDGESVYACYDETIYTAKLNFVDIVKNAPPVVETLSFEGNTKYDCKTQIELFKTNTPKNRKYINTEWSKRKERKRFDITLDIRIAIGEEKQGL